jgi:osmotically-inducible protein OsmY
MKNVLFASALFLTSLALAQQQGQPPNTMPPTSPREEMPQRQMPPDHEAQPLSAAQVEERIQQDLDSEPALSNTNVSVKTTEDSIVLVGTVETEKQHDLMLRLAQSDAGDRKIVDNIRVQQQT